MNDNIKMYAAPMEGFTGFAWRKAHREVFGGADKYFTPFVVANQNHKFKTKELRDLTQNEENLVPQILTDKAEHFIWAARELKEKGFTEINLNLGCPSATVVTKGKGSGILRDMAGLERMLDGIFSAVADTEISLKTRIGFENKNEWFDILKIFEKYPVKELTVHPRLRSEFYEGSADTEIFKETMAVSKLNLVYNGDIISKDNEAFGFGCNIMAGRGILKNPALFREAKGGKPASKEELKKFHDLLVEYYASYMPGDGPLLQHMKSFWVYFADMFEYDEKTMKKLKKAKKLSEYMSVVESITER